MDLHEGGTELLPRLQLRFATSFRICFLQGQKSEGPRGSSSFYGAGHLGSKFGACCALLLHSRGV